MSIYFKWDNKTVDGIIDININKIDKQKIYRL